MNPPKIPSVHFLHQNKEYGLQLSPKLFKSILSPLFILSFLYPAFIFYCLKCYKVLSVDIPVSYFIPKTSGLVSHTADNILKKYISDHSKHFSKFCHGYPSLWISMLQLQHSTTELLELAVAHLFGFHTPAPCLFDKYKYLQSRIEWTLWQTGCEIWGVEEEKVFR